jgi:hypothetical protein
MVSRKSRRRVCAVCEVALNFAGRKAVRVQFPPPAHTEFLGRPRWNHPGMPD